MYKDHSPSTYEGAFEDPPTPLAPKILTVSAPAGAGKTAALIREIADHLVKDYNVLVVMPTRRLIKQFVQDLALRGVIASSITTDNKKENVSRDIMKFFRDAPDFGVVLVITWEAYKALPDILRKQNWKTFIDEVPKVDDPFDFDLVRHVRFITDHVVAEPSGIDGMTVLKARDPRALRELMYSDKDTVDEVFRKLYTALCSPNVEVFTPTAEYEPIRHKGGKISCTAMLNTRLFAGATLLGANMEHQLLMKWLARRHGAKIREHKKLCRALRYRELNVADRVELVCFRDVTWFSKHKRDGLSPNGVRLGVLMDQGALAEFSDSKFIHVANDKWDGGVLIPGLTNAVPVPAYCHGLNAYADITGAYVAAALNRTPAQCHKMEMLGFTKDELQIGTACEVYYQAIMRTALRNPDSTATVKVLVPCEEAAKVLARYFGIPVTCIKSIALPQHKPAKRSYSRKEVQRRKARFDGWEELRTKKVLHPFTKDFGTKFVPNVQVTFHDEVGAEHDHEFWRNELSIQGLIQKLRTSAAGPVAVKDESGLLNAAIFHPYPRGYGFKTYENCAQVAFAILDFDKSNLPPARFIEHFGEKAPPHQRLSFVICNTFSRSPEEPNRFRVFIFYQYPATKEQQLDVYDYILYRLSKVGIDLDAAGLDDFRKGVKSAYMPCTNRHHPDWALFEAHNTSTEDLQKYGLEPAAVPHQAEKAFRHRLSDAAVGSVPRPASEAAIASAQHHLEVGRNHWFWMVALALAHLRHEDTCLSRHAIECELYRLAGDDKTMIKRVQNKMDSLEKYGHLIGR